MSQNEETTIASYTGQRLPLRVNVFEALKGACTALLPVFPYVGPNAIVPCFTMWYPPGPARFDGRLWHQNSVTEVALSLFATGEGGLPVGTVIVGGDTHPVGADESGTTVGGPPEDGAAMLTITVRHAGPEQRESVIFRCTKCKHKLFEYPWRYTPHNEGETMQPLVTITGGLPGAEKYNEAHRTCEKCGHVNKPFDFAAWGLQKYQINVELAQEAQAALARVEVPRREAHAKAASA